MKKNIQQQFEKFYLENSIVFDNKLHRYTINGETFAGASTIAEYTPKEFLIAWGCKMMAEALIDKQEQIKTLTAKEYTDLINNSKSAYRRKSKEALEIGSIVHEYLEKYLKKENPEMPKNKEAQNAINNFLAFEKKHKVKWIALEKIVCSLKHKVAGRFDALAEVDGKLSIIDFKTSSQISESYYLQLAFYAEALKEMGICEVEQRIILRLPKKENDEFEACLIPTPVEEDLKAFLGLRESWKWHKWVNCMFSEKEDVYYGDKKYTNNKLKYIKL